MRIAHKVKKVTASFEVDQNRRWEDMDLYEQIAVMKKFVRNYKGSKVFEDFAEHVGEDVEDIIDTFCDAEAHGDIKIPWNKQKDSEYANDDIYGSATNEPVKGAYDYYNIPGPGDYDPPEYDEGRELDPEVDTVECTLDAIIIIDEDYDYEYEDKDYKWAAGYSRNGDWESNIYSGLTLCSKIDVVENVDEMLMDILDYTPGRYHIQGEVTLKFDIDGAVAYSNNAKYEEDYEEIIEVDSSDVTYNKKESYIEGFIQEPVVS